MSLKYNPNDDRHLRDAQHANNLFTYYGMSLAPKVPFLYHVVFTLKDDAVQKAAPNTYNFNKEVGVLAKRIDLPSFKASIETKQQYNRKKNYQTRIDYDEIRCTFHDDNAGITTTMLREYYNFYYRDGRNGKYNFGTRDKYSDQRNRYGLDNNTVNTFFDYIKIYQLSRKQWFSFTLVNPILTSWEHDTLDYAEGAGMMENNISVAYEAVLYDRGEIGAKLQTGSNTITFQGNEPTNFTNPATGYDQVHSPLISNGSASGLEVKNTVGPDYSAKTTTFKQQEFNPNTQTLDFSRGPSPVIKNDTQGTTTLASSPSFNRLSTSQPLSAEEIQRELEQDPALQDTVTKQAVLQGQIEGLDASTAANYDNLTVTEQTSIKQTITSRATDPDRSKVENLKASVTATNVIEAKKTRILDTREPPAPPPTPAERLRETEKLAESYARRAERGREQIAKAKADGSKTPAQIEKAEAKVARIQASADRFEREAESLRSGVSDF